MTTQSSGASTLQTCLVQERGPIVFSQTYEYNLDYTFVPDLDTLEGDHFELHWARGAGGSNTEISWSVGPDGISSNVFIEVWPPDNGYRPSLKAQTWYASYWNGVLTSSITGTQDPPSVGWMEKSASGANRPDWYYVDWTESSGREVRLFTGGSATRQNQSLFDLSTSLAYEDSPVNPQVYDWSVIYWPSAFTPFLPSASPPVGVPPKEITLGAEGNLDSDGHRFKVHSGASEVVITPKAPGTSYTGDLPGVTEHRLVSHTLHQALTNPDPERTKLGVGEEVSIYFDPELQMTFPETPWWLAFDGSVWPNVGSAVTFTAPSNAVPRTTVRVFVRDAQLDKYFTVVEPQSYDHAIIVSTNRYLPPMSAVGMQLKVFFAPTDVSLYRVEIEEVGGYAIDLWGVYVTYPPEEHVSGVFQGLNDNNSWKVLDDCGKGAEHGCPGGFTVPIPANWRIPGGSANPMTGWNQVFSIDEAGTCEMDKFDRWVRRSTNDVVTTH